MDVITQFHEMMCTLDHMESVVLCFDVCSAPMETDGCKPAPLKDAATCVMLSLGEFTTRSMNSSLCLCDALVWGNSPPVACCSVISVFEISFALCVETRHVWCRLSLSVCASCRLVPVIRWPSLGLCIDSNSECGF